MNFIDYVPLAIRTEKPLPQMDRLVHGCMGLITEIGEVTTELKRMAIYEKPLDEERKAHILEEIGDVLWYVAIITDAAQLPKGQLQDASTTIVPFLSAHLYEATALVLSQKCGTICKMIAKIKAGASKKSNFSQKMTENLIVLIVALVVLTEKCGANLDKVMTDNITKLQVRYPDKYSNEAAESRADKAGADARVS